MLNFHRHSFRVLSANKIVSPYLVGQEQGISVLGKAIIACTESIEKHKGKLLVKEEPRAVSATPFISILISLCRKTVISSRFFCCVKINHLLGLGMSLSVY